MENIFTVAMSRLLLGVMLNSSVDDKLNWDELAILREMWSLSPEQFSTLRVTNKK